MKKAKKALQTGRGKKAKVSRKQKSSNTPPGHQGRFDQLLNDAVLGVEKKKPA